MSQPKPGHRLYYAAGETVLQRLPARLYKFSGLDGKRREWMRKLIVDSCLYFAPPRSFNDPLDCRVPPCFDADMAIKKQYWTELARNQVSDPEELARFADHGSRLTDDPVKQRELCESLFDLAANTGVACFTANSTEMLLWSYYANGHNGIAVEFNWSPRTIELLGKLLVPFEVVYKDQFPPVNYYTNTKGELIHSMIATKASAWKHEQEWRIVLPDGPELVRLPPPMITAVLIGMRLDKELEEEVKGWIADRRGPPLKLLRAAHVQGGFRIELLEA